MTKFNRTDYPQKALLDITEVVPFNENDKPIVEEIISVLKKHNALDRFGLTLLHQHFDVSEDEVLVETTDTESRVQTIQPYKIKDVDPDDSIETAWRLDSGTAVMSCLCIKVGSHMHLPRPSDLRLKMKVEDAEYGINEIMQLRPVTYYYMSNDITKELPKAKQLGLIAQEAEVHIPEIIFQKSNYKSIDYVALIPILIKALQEQQKEITNLQNQVAELKSVEY